MKDKDGRYIIDETTLLPDLLEEKKLYVNHRTKEVLELNIYEFFLITMSDTEDKLTEVKNEKAAKVLFKDNRQKLPKGI